ncbi:MAG: SAM-dependent methyltransferase [Pseudomonadota bacterium]
MPQETSPQRTRPILDRLLFFLLWLRRPMRIANITPSGKHLAAAMVRGVPMAKPGSVVELGGGTGVFTEAMITAGLPADDLVIIEREKALHSLLTKRFPSSRVVLGDARDIHQIANEADANPVKAVVSGLPILTMNDEIQTAIMGGAFQAMDEDGVFVQFTYGPKSPVRSSVLEALGLKAVKAEKVPRNVPPASVYHYTRAAAP